MKSEAMTNKEDTSARVESLLGRTGGGVNRVDLDYLPEVGDENTVEAAILRAQKGYPELSLQALMAGILPSTQVDYAGDVYCLQVAPASAAGTLWLWQHDEPFTWGRGAPSFTQLGEMLRLLEQYDDLGLDDIDIEDEVDVSELRDMLTAKERLATIEDDDLRENLTPIVEAWAALGVGADAPASYDFSGLQELLEYLIPPPKEQQSAPDWLTRCGWIATTLVGNLHYISDAPMGEAAQADFKEAAARPDIAEHVPDALYWLFWAFFVGGDDEVALLADKVEQSPARLVRDAAALVRELSGGRTTIGATDLHAARELFRAEQQKQIVSQAQAGDVTAMRAKVRALDLKELRDWPPGLEEYKSLERLTITAWDLPAALGRFPRMKALDVLGPLPAEVNQLGSLEEVLCGGLPESVSGLGNLRRLEITVNGALTADLGPLVQLEELELRSESRKFTVPASIGALPKLRKATLFSRYHPGGKTGKITLSDGLAQISTLEELVIAAPFAKFPKDWSKATKLSHIKLGIGDDAGLKNVSPLAKAPALTSLDYIGDKPKALDKLTKLEALALHSKLSAEELLALLPKLPQLKRLTTNTRGIAEGLRALEQLEALELSISEEECGQLSETLLALPSLRELKPVCFAAPAEASQGNPGREGERRKVFEGLEVLDLSVFTPVTDIFVTLETVPNLRRLIFNAVGYNPKCLPPGLSACTRLKEAYLGPCELAPGALDGIEALTGLERLEVPTSSLGRLPDSMAELSQLRVLNVGGNPIETLPEWCTELPLEELDLTYCPLTALPASLPRMKSLRRLRLNAEKLDVPSALAVLAELPALRELCLHDIRSDGLPEGLFELSRLDTLELRVCDFGGAAVGPLRMRLPTTLVVARANWF